MGELYLRSRHSFPRIMNVLILILLIGLWESKVQRNLKDPWRHFGPNCSQHSNQRDIENLLVLHLKEKKKVMTHPRRAQLQMNERRILLCDVIRDIHYLFIVIQIVTNVRDILLFYE